MGNWWDRTSNLVRLSLVFVPLVVILFVAFASASQLVLSGGLQQTATTATPVDLPPESDTTRSSVPSPTFSAMSSTPTTSPAASGDGLVARFLDLLSALPEDDSPALHTGYDRDFFRVWSDADNDGCNTRAEVLMSETTTTITVRGKCTVESGAWYSAYDGKWFTSASGVDIDHLVPLKEAWLSGAWEWDASTRAAFGNDLGYPASLLAVSAASNRSKSDQDPARWLPPNSGFACDYAASWIAVKWRWSLSVDVAERSTLSNILSGCSQVAVDLPEKATVVRDTTARMSPRPGGRGSGDGVVDPDFGTCAVAQSQGFGPYISGVDPEYSFYRDADNDGIVCE